MGVFSKVHRYRELGEAANVNNVEQFGEPDHSLFSSSKFLSLHHEMEITDDAGNTAYRAESKFFSLHDKTDVSDASGRHVAHSERKVLSLHQKHFITMADGTQFEMSTELWHLVKDIINLPELGWQIRGNILALNFELYDEDEQIIAVISQKLLSLHDKYCVDIYQPEHEDIVVTILITLQHMIADREAASSASSSASSSSSN